MLLIGGMCDDLRYVGRGKDNHVSPGVEHCVMRREQHQPNVAHLTIFQEDVMSEAACRVFRVGPECRSKNYNTRNQSNKEKTDEQN